MNIIKGEFQETGINEVDIDFVVSKWSHLWMLSQYGTEWRLVKYRRKDSQITTIKTAISLNQAYELIKRLDLKEERSPVFNKASSWRRERDYLFLEEYRMTKYK